jgi:hypothetical protein
LHVTGHEESVPFRVLHEKIRVTAEIFPTLFLKVPFFKTS